MKIVEVGHSDQTNIKALIENSPSVEFVFIDEMKAEPLNEIIESDKAYLIVKQPEIREIFVDKKKHGHKRPYKYHR